MPIQHCEAEFVRLYAAHAPSVRATATRLLSCSRDHPQVDDLVQETFARLWRAMRERDLRFETEGIARAYLCRIALNLVRDEARRRRVVSMERLAGDDEEIGKCQPGPVVEPFGEALDRLIDARVALLALPAPTRALILRAAAGHSSREPVEKSRLARARAALREVARVGEEKGYAR